jgi:hypothetical protein
MARVRKGVESMNLALVCSERDPIECHRAVLVCHRIGPLRDSITHLHTDGRRETQPELDERLVALHGLTPMPLLAGPNAWSAAVERAYSKQAEAIAYREKPTEARA